MFELLLAFCIRYSIVDTTPKWFGLQSDHAGELLQQIKRSKLDWIQRCKLDLVLADNKKLHAPISLEECQAISQRHQKKLRNEFYCISKTISEEALKNLLPPFLRDPQNIVLDKSQAILRQHYARRQENGYFREQFQCFTEGDRNTLLRIATAFAPLEIVQLYFDKKNTSMQEECLRAAVWHGNRTILHSHFDDFITSVTHLFINNDHCLFPDYILNVFTVLLQCDDSAISHDSATSIPESLTHIIKIIRAYGLQSLFNLAHLPEEKQEEKIIEGLLLLILDVRKDFFPALLKEFNIDENFRYSNSGKTLLDFAERFPDINWPFTPLQRLKYWGSHLWFQFQGPQVPYAADNTPSAMQEGVASYSHVGPS